MSIALENNIELMRGLTRKEAKHWIDDCGYDLPYIFFLLMGEVQTSREKMIEILGMTQNFADKLLKEEVDLQADDFLDETANFIRIMEILDINFKTLTRILAITFLSVEIGLIDEKDEVDNVELDDSDIDPFKKEALERLMKKLRQVMQIKLMTQPLD